VVAGSFITTGCCVVPAYVMLVIHVVIVQPVVVVQVSGVSPISEPPIIALKTEGFDGCTREWIWVV